LIINRLYTIAYDIIGIYIEKGCDDMSNKERIMQLIDNVPDNKLVFVVDMLESLKAYAGESIEPDAWDLQMIEESKMLNDGERVTFDELCDELGITI
jgi:hypothetical protein